MDSTSKPKSDNVQMPIHSTYNGKRIMAVRPLIRTLTVPRSNAPTQPVINEIFTISTPKSLQQKAVTIMDDSFTNDTQPVYWGPVCYIKHRNLDVRPLTFIERLRLARVHYLTVANAIRVALVLLFLCWFLYNAVTLLHDYQEHNSMVYLEYVPPDKTRPPAITICSHCVLCAFKANATVHAEHILNNDYIWKELNSTDRHDQSKDVDIKCSVLGSTWGESPNATDCARATPVVKSMQEGHKCFTYFSNIYGDMTRLNASQLDARRLIFDQIPLIKFTINGKFLYGKSSYRYQRLENSFHNSSSYTKNDDQPGIGYTGLYWTIHDRDILPDMYSMQFYRLQMGKLMAVSFEKRIEKLKPQNCFTYRTNSLNVRPDELEMPPNGLDNRSIVGKKADSEDTKLKLYRSRGDCFLYCMWRLLNLHRCANMYSIFTLEMVNQEQYYNSIANVWYNKSKEPEVNFDENEKKSKVKFCARTNKTYGRYLLARKQCLVTCPAGCTIESYGEEDINSLQYEGKTNSSFLEIHWSRKPIAYVEHRNKMNICDFLGSLGGQAHIWLGMSIPYLLQYVIKLIQWGEFLPHHTCCCIFTWWRSCFIRQKTRRRNAL